MVSNITLLILVCVTIKDNYPKYILTMDYLPGASFDGIQHVNVFDWLTIKE